MEEVVRMLGNSLRVCEKHYAKSVQSRLGLACSGNVERIGIVLSKPNHTKSLKNQWRATYAPGYLAAGSLFTRLAEREGFDCGLFPYRLVCKEIAKIPANMG